jgi:hypothetical protein
MAFRERARLGATLLLCAMELPTTGCSKTQIPEVRGRVVEAADGQPVANAIVVATYVGNTIARGTWFMAHAHVQQQRCFRTLVRTDSDGTFKTHLAELSAFFGKPYWRFKVFHAGFRSRVSGYDSDETRFELKVWRDDQAMDFDVFTGQRIDYGRIEHPDRLRDKQRDLATFLDDWLSHGQVLSPCDFEERSGERTRLIFDLYRQWLALGGPSLNKGRSLACDAFAAFRLDHPTEKEVAEFLSLAEEIHQGCAAAKRKPL